MTAVLAVAASLCRAVVTDVLHRGEALGLALFPDGGQAHARRNAAAAVATDERRASLRRERDAALALSAARHAAHVPVRAGTSRAGGPQRRRDVPAPRLPAPRATARSAASDTGRVTAVVSGAAIPAPPVRR